LAPSTSTDDSPAGARGAFDDAGPVAADLDGLNRFDAALCEVFPVALLPDLTVAERLLFAGFILADLVDGPGACLREDDLEDFLRVFLDIRLPFVAFGGSIIRLLQVSFSVLDSGRRLGKSDGRGVWLKRIRRTTHPLVECAPRVQ
jgi:hypothetical protein